MEQVSQSQLFNTSWTLYRLSPLHHGKDCETLLGNSTALRTYSTRLREQLTGDALAGLHASATTADDNALSKTGALKNCNWQFIITGSPQRNGGPRQRVAEASYSGILVTLEYENVTYKAALLTHSATLSHAQGQHPGSTLLPLLLIKCPNALRQTFISFLCANFDTYCSALRLPPNFLCVGLECFVNELRSNTRPLANDLVGDVIKELQLTLSFSSSIAPALRTLNISISRDSLVDFLRDAPDVRAKGRADNEKPWNPLIENVTLYLETHLAMKLDMDGSSQKQIARQHVRLSKIACAAFVLGSEGRMKLVVADRPAEEEEISVRDELALRASEVLLQAVIRKAVIDDQAGT